MTNATLEDVYAAIAEGIDAAGREREALFLSKVVLLLAHELGDPAKVLAVIADCLEDLEGMTTRGNGRGRG